MSVDASKINFCHLLSRIRSLVIFTHAHTTYFLRPIRLTIRSFVICRIIPTDYRGCNNLSYTIHLRQEYVVSTMDLEVFVPPLPASVLEMKVRIRTDIENITADMIRTVWNELDYHADVCRITKGAHIEHL